MYASSTTTIARPSRDRVKLRMESSLSRLPVGLLGEQRKTSLTSRVHLSSTARSSSAKPASARKGTATTAAP